MSVVHERVRSLDLRLAWAAGFLDGEGSFVLRKISKPNQHTPGVVRRKAAIYATQTVTREPLDRLQSLFGGSVRELRPTITGRRSWIWQLETAGVDLAVETLLPYLTVKREAALILREHRATFKRNGPIRLSPATLTKRAILEGTLQKMQKRPRVLSGGAA